MFKNSCRVSVVFFVVLTAWSQVAPPNVQQIANLALTTEAQQRQPGSQQILTDWFLFRVRTYIQILQPYAIGSRVNLGYYDSFRDRMALYGGDANWILIWRNLNTGGPRKDPGEPFIFPNDGNINDLLNPQNPATLATCWHELQHGLLAEYALSTPGFWGVDQEHVYIEGYAQNTMAWLLDLNGNRRFENLVRQAYEAQQQYRQKGGEISYEAERQIWGRANEAWRLSWPNTANILALDPPLRAEFFTYGYVRVPTVEEVIGFYMDGNVRTNSNVPIRVPGWVVSAQPITAPVAIDRNAARDNAAVSQGILRHSTRFDVRALTATGSNTSAMMKNPVTRGQLTVRLEGDDDRASLSLRIVGQPLAGMAGPGGASNRMFQINLPAYQQPLLNRESFELTFIHRQTSAIRGQASFQIVVEYRDGGNATDPPVYAPTRAVFWVDVKGTGQTPITPPAKPQESAAQDPSTTTVGDGLEGIWRGTGVGGSVHRDMNERMWNPKKADEEERKSREALPKIAFAVSINKAAPPNDYHVQLRPDVGALVKKTNSFRSYVDRVTKETYSKADYEGRTSDGFIVYLTYYKSLGDGREWLDAGGSNGGTFDPKTTQYLSFRAEGLKRDGRPAATKAVEPAVAQGQAASQMRMNPPPPVSVPPELANEKPKEGTIKPVTVRKPPTPPNVVKKPRKPRASADLSGTWRVPEDPEDCIVIQQSGDSIQGRAYYKGSQVGDLTGFSRGGGTVLAMRRLNNSDLAAWIFVQDAGSNLSGKSLNPDGSQRWRGSYACSTAPPPSSRPVPATPPGGSLDLSGTWTAANDRDDRIVIQQTGESIQGQAFYRGRQVSEIIGFSRGGQCVLAIRRVDNSDLAVWIFVPGANNTLTGKSLNPDGSERWRGTYMRSSRD